MDGLSDLSSILESLFQDNKELKDLLDPIPVKTVVTPTSGSSLDSRVSLSGGMGRINCLYVCGCAGQISRGRFVCMYVVFAVDIRPASKVMLAESAIDSFTGLDSSSSGLLAILVFIWCIPL